MQRRGSVNGSAASSRIRVAVRVRPPDCKIPKDETRAPCVAASPNPNAPNVLEFRHDTQSKTFTFDHVYGASATQEDVYASALQPLMAQFLDGYNVTVMAYGQTGSGKTYTMGNKATVFNTTPTTSPCRERASSIPAPTIATSETRSYQGSPDDGLMPRFLNDLFMNLKREPSMKEIRVTFVEIYLDTIRDLLDDRSDKSLTIREDTHNVWVENVRSIQVETLARALEVLNAGRARQTVGMNALNDESSRSHAVYTLEVSRKFSSEIKKSKLTFVDLAGSERIKKTEVEGTRRRESININMGLSTLSNVINALADQRKLQQRRVNQDSSTSRPSSPDIHIPYRSSKLTRLLRDGLGGNARTLIIACVSPLDSNADETMNTLQFANRARNIQNKAEKNVHHDLFVVTPNPSELEIARLHEDVKRLQQQIIDLEATSRQREEGIASAEQARIQRKEKKRDNRRDAEMTTEVAILPQVDANTQHEGEVTGEKRLSFADVDTMTDRVDDIPAPASIDVVDASVQFGVTASELVEVAIMTDQETRILTTETCTVCDLAATPSVDSETQIGTSYLYVKDIETSTDPEPLVEIHDVSTECFTESATDSECQYDLPTQVTDAETLTESEPVVETTDTFTECVVSELVDIDCQSDISCLHAVDASVCTNVVPETIDEVTDSPTVVDTASQYDLPLLTDVGISTDEVATLTLVDVSTACVAISVSDIACQSEIASADIATVTDTQPEATDSSTDCVLMCSTDEATQVEVPTSHRIDFGMTTDPEPFVLTASVSTECYLSDLAHTAVQCDAACSVDVGVVTEDGLADRTPDVLGIDDKSSLVDTAAQPGLSIMHSSDQGMMIEDGSDAPDPSALAEICQDKTHRCFPAGEFNTNAQTDAAHLGCPSPTSSVSTLSDTGDGVSPINAPASAADRITVEKKLRTDDETTKVGEEFTSVSKRVDRPHLSLTKTVEPVPFSSLSDLHAVQEVFEVARVTTSEVNVLEALVEGKSTKATRSLTPEVEEDEFVETASGHSENQREIGACDERTFVCSPLDEDKDIVAHTATIRGVPDEEPVIFEASRTVIDLDDHAFTSDFTPSTILLVVKPPAIQMHLQHDSGIIGPCCPGLQDPPSQQPPPPTADFVVVRSPRRGKRAGLQAVASQQISPRGAMPKRSASPSLHQAVRPLRMFAFDDHLAINTPEETAVQAKHLYENLRQLARAEFGDDTDGICPSELLDATTTRTLSTVGQLMTETKEFIKRRQKRQQRIAQLRCHVLALEDVLHVENRAPISEPELKAYSERAQEEFLCKLSQQLLTLAAERLHSRLKARIEAERAMPLPSGDDDDTTCPFLSLDQCQACAEWFFRRVDDAEFFEKQVLPLITSGWIPLTSSHLEAEQAWFQL